MNQAIAKVPTLDKREFEGGIEWIIARELIPVQDELAHLRAQIDALREALQPW